MNKIGLRVDFDKDGGLFRKLTRPNRYPQISAVRSGSDGQDFVSVGSNLGRRLRIEWPGRVGRAGRRRKVAGAELRGGAWPELAKRALQGPNRDAVGLGRWFGAQSMMLVGDGGSAAQGSPP